MMRLKAFQSSDQGQAPGEGAAGDMDSGKGCLLGASSERHGQLIWTVGSSGLARLWLFQGLGGQHRLPSFLPALGAETAWLETER